MRPSSLVALVSALLLSSSLSGCSRAARSGTASGLPAEGAPTGASPAAERSLPEEKLLALDGSTKQLSEIVRGKVAVIDLWATWCTSCRQVSAHVASFAEAHAADSGMVVIGLDIGEELPIVASFLEGKKHAHPFFLDPAMKITDDLSLRELPTIIVVDRKGRIVHISRDLDPKTLQMIDAELTAVPPPG